MMDGYSNDITCNLLMDTHLMDTWIMQEANYSMDTMAIWKLQRASSITSGKE